MALAMEYVPLLWAFPDGSIHGIFACIVWMFRKHYPWNECLYYMDILKALSMELVPAFYGCPVGIIHGIVPVFNGSPDGSIQGINACIIWTS